MTEGIGAKGAALYRLQTIDCRLISPCAPSEAIAECRKYSGVFFVVIRKAAVRRLQGPAPKTLPSFHCSVFTFFSVFFVVIKSFLRRCC